LVTHKNISNLRHDSDSSHYHGIGGGGEVLPPEE
jgi:hypothetical protein